MIGYVMVGASDLDKSAAFFEKVLGDLGGKVAWRNERIVAFTSGAGPQLMICKPYDEKAPMSGNGTMVALAASSNEQVQSVYKAALAVGASDEGEPGPRGEPELGFYGGYFRDLDNNKFCVFCVTR